MPDKRCEFSKSGICQVSLEGGPMCEVEECVLEEEEPSG